MIKKITLPLALMILTSTASQAQSVVGKYKQFNKDFNISNKAQSFCYRDRRGEIYGHNTHRPVTIASVSKLVTSLWAIEELGVDYRYETKFYLQGKKLHISGSLDPVFSNRKLFVLLAQLNMLGINELDEITFDKNLRIYTKAERYVGRILNITPARTAANLKDFWNTPTWNKLKPFYNDFAKSTPRALKDHFSLPDTWEGLNMKVGSVKVVDMNPLGESGYVHLAPHLERYLKFLNIVSNNYISDEIFNKLGGEAGFDAYFKKIQKDFDPSVLDNAEDKSRPIVKMYTGSGLDSKRNGQRVDNYATCAAILELIDRLDSKLEESQVAIQKVVAVPGTDRGTFRKRLRSPRMAKTFVAKTGTLYHTSALAGKLYGANSPVTFGIFHQLTGWKGNAKMVQNKTVETLWMTYAPKEKFEYQPTFFFPADKVLEPITIPERPAEVEELAEEIGEEVLNQTVVENTTVQ